MSLTDPLWDSMLRAAKRARRARELKPKVTPLVTCGRCGRSVHAVWPSKVRPAGHKRPDGAWCS